MNQRDPRTDPAKGDVLKVFSFVGLVTVRVVGRAGEVVSYLLCGRLMHTRLSGWKSLAAEAEVVERGEG